MRAYYNEVDSYCAEWLRNLAAAGEITEGGIDERDIRLVQADELRSYRRAHFFAGIAGWDYALRLAAWPEDREVWTGSCPCQPLSSAGKRQGHADERHLWPAFYALIAECRPATIFGEQVASKDGREWLAGVRADLEAIGYAFGAADLCAAGIGAPHIRQRLFWVADADGGNAQDGNLQRGGQHGQRPQDDGAGSGMADSTDPRRNDAREYRGGSSSLSARPEQCGVDGGLAESGGRSAESRCEPVGMANTESERSQRRSDENERLATQGSGLLSSRPGDAITGGMGNADDARPQGHGQPGERAGELSPWSASQLIQCRDGKVRRIPLEPSIFPLASGVSGGRVGKLRAAGNAIIPQVAAEFIKAFLET